MKTLILSLLLVSTYANVLSKNIKGRVLDSENQPIEFANDDCDKIRVSYIGFTDAVRSPIDSNLGNIILQQTSITLKEVVVKAPLIRREADRIILNVAANPLSANKDAQELLKTAPGVWAFVTTQQ